MVENIAGFEAVVAYAELPTPSGQPHTGAAGGRIDLTGIQAQSLTYVPGSGTNPGTLKLYAGTDPTGDTVAELKMRLLTDNLSKTATQMASADFSLSDDGHGGTIVTYNPGGSTYLLESLPAPVIASAGEVVKLSDILKESFGKGDVPFKGIWLYPSQPFDNTSTNVGYWDTPNVTPEWYIGDKKVETATFVKDISKVRLHVGNEIDNPASFQMRLTDDKRGPDATFVTYDVWTVDPAVIQAMQIAGIVPGAAPTPETIVKAAEAFLTVYGDGVIPNTNLCNWIADNVAAAAGAPMPAMNASLDPSLNLEGGFWRIAYASDIPDPVADWSGLVQPGDIVRMGWFNPEAGRISGHSTTVLSYAENGKVEFYDNNDGQHIGRHEAAYWLATDPEDITIYRLDPNHQYLIQGTDAAETIRGSVYDNLIRPGGGKDLIQAKFGNTEIEGTSAELNGIKAQNFNFGNSFHFIDLDPDQTSVAFRDGRLFVYEGSDRVAKIDVPKPKDGFSFVATSDSDGGVAVKLGRPEIEVEGNGVVIADGDRTPSVADDTDFGTVMKGGVVVHTFTVSNDGLADLKISKLKLPNGFQLVEGLSSKIGAGESDTFRGATRYQEGRCEGRYPEHQDQRHRCDRLRLQIVRHRLARPVGVLASAACEPLRGWNRLPERLRPALKGNASRFRTTGRSQRRCRHALEQDLLKDSLGRLIGEGMQFGGGLVLHRMRHEHRCGVETDRPLLLLEGIAEFGGQHAHAGDAFAVEIVEIVCRAGRARAAIRQRDDDGVAGLRDLLDHLARRDAGVGRLLEASCRNTARIAQLLEPVDELVAAHLADVHERYRLAGAGIQRLRAVAQYR